MKKVFFFTVSAALLILLIFLLRPAVSVQVAEQNSTNRNHWTPEAANTAAMAFPEEESNDNEPLLLRNSAPSDSTYGADVRNDVAINSSDFLHHPLIQNHDAGTLRYIERYGEWLLISKEPDINKDDLDKLLKNNEEQNIDVNNREEMARYLLGLCYYRALAGRDSDTFHQRTERYITLQQQMAKVAPEASESALRDKLFSADEQRRMQAYADLLRQKQALKELP